MSRKTILLVSIFVLLKMIAFGQADFLQKVQPRKFSEDEKWNLDKYLWSTYYPRQQQGDKPLIDYQAIDNWKGLGDGQEPTISRNGHFFAYSTEFTATLKSDFFDSLVVQSINNSWRRAFAKVKPGFFSGDSRQYVYEDIEGLCFLTLGSDEVHYLKGVLNYKLTTDGRNEWMACHMKDKTSTLVLQNLYTGSEKRFDSVSSYSFNNTNEWLICQIKNVQKDLLLYNLNTKDSKRFQSATGYLFNSNRKILVIKTIEEDGLEGLQYVNLEDGKTIKVWSASNKDETIGNFKLDDAGRQLVFIVQSPNVINKSTVQRQSDIWLWREGMDKSVMKLNNESLGVSKDLLIQGSVSFTENGRYILFSLQQPPIQSKLAAGSVALDVWSYKDVILQSTQPYLNNEPKLFSAILDCQTGNVVRLTSEYENLKEIKGDYALIFKSIKEKKTDRFWEKDFDLDSNWLVSLRDGHRKYISRGFYSQYRNIRFSPSGRYLVYFDPDNQCHYYSYEIKTGKQAKISVAIPDWQLGMIDENVQTSEKPIRETGWAGWLDGDRYLLVYDRKDIWQLDLSGTKPAVNVTNGVGRSQHIIFSLITNQRNSPSCPVFSSLDTVILFAFDYKNKYNGFYKKAFANAGNPELLHLGPYFFCGFYGIRGVNGGRKPLKAADVNIWIVQRQSAIEAPNYFVTTDFKSFLPITNLQPHNKYNWFTSELHSFKRLDGTIAQGILYKPANFDSSKKYPIIISFYNSLSDRLYNYPNPSYLYASSIFDNPAWMVSHGYLVFTPDMYFPKNNFGYGTYSTIDGAAKYLKTLRYVDGNHLAAVGHSNSGRFGYYLLTHSRSFAAMSISSGFCGADVLSGSLSLSRPRPGTKQVSNLDWLEKDAVGTGLGNIWENKETWIEHIAPLQADKIVNPLLLFHNNNDGDDVRLAIELFIAMRRLEKKTWWLQYDNGAHTVMGNDAKDWTIRYTQFFDHYLKQAPAPRWMTQGIPNKLKGIEARYELDAAGSCAMQGKNHCYVCEAWNKQYQRNPAMFQNEIKDWSLDKDVKEELDKKTTAERKKLDKEQEIENKRIVDILKNGYPEDNKTKTKTQK